MGMFDSVYVQCPHCEEEVEIQTKHGECILGQYYLYNAPADVLIGVEGRHHCDECGMPFSVKTQIVTRAWVEPEHWLDEEDE